VKSWIAYGTSPLFFEVLLVQHGDLQVVFLNKMFACCCCGCEGQNSLASLSWLCTIACVLAIVLLLQAAKESALVISVIAAKSVFANWKRVVQLYMIVLQTSCVDRKWGRVMVHGLNT
jgi:hypothetical protein